MESGGMSAGKEYRGRRVAVTGATGMVGSHIVARLLTEGYVDVVLPVRNKSRLSNMYATLDRFGLPHEQPALKIIETELTDTASLAAALDGVDTVFNSVARIMSGDMTTEQLIENNVSLTRSVVDASLAAGVRKLVHVSSISALGTNVPAGSMIDEECAPGNITQDAAYGQSKYYSELEVRRGEEAGLQTVMVLPGVILGEGEWKGSGSAAMIPLISSGLPVCTGGLMSYVDVRDVARAIVMLDGIPEAVGQRFVLSAGNVSYRDLITMAAEAAGRPRPFVSVGQKTVSAVYRTMRALIRLSLMKDRGVTERNLGSVIRRNRYDGTKIMRFCGFEYTPIEETVSRVVKAYRSEKRTKK